MQHTLVAVFDNRGDADAALEDLVSSGFSREDVRLSEEDPTGAPQLAPEQRKPADESFGSGIKHFFTDIFGTDRSEDAKMYSDAVTRGHHVLTLMAVSEPEVERAADIVERHGPVDIDEHAAQWRAGVPGQDTARMGAQQQSASQSQQAGQAQVQGGVVQGGSLQGGAAQDAQQRAGGTTAIPVIQEEIKVGKRDVERGGVRVFRHVVETPVHESIGLREEHVKVERNPVDRPVDPADLNAFQEGTIELREHAEEAVVEKSARVVEEVIVGKQVDERQQQIDETVRRTEVDIEELTPDEDAYFRSHWTRNFAGEGGSYEDWAPAYRYGNAMARTQLYRGRPWNDVESDLRTDWESRNRGSEQSTWEKVKAAVRHGWERVKT